VIVTRHRKRRRHLLRRIGLPLLALAALIFAVSWPPSQHVIANSPLKPAWNAGAKIVAVVGRPFSFAAERQTIVERNRTIRTLNGQLEQERQAKVDADTRVKQLQQQVATLSAAAATPKATPFPLPSRSATLPNATSASALLAGASPAPAPSADDVKRLAATWAAMEPEKAAAMIQRLPDDEVTRVLAQMDSDSAGEIMSALPAAVAARISRASAQVSPTSNR
jgi:flagellar motility protein MotE (MotC chaperone)